MAFAQAVLESKIIIYMNFPSIFFGGYGGGWRSSAAASQTE